MGNFGKTFCLKYCIMKKFILSLIAILAISVAANAGNYTVNDDAIDALIEASAEVSPLELMPEAPVPAAASLATGSPSPVAAFLLCTFLGILLLGGSFIAINVFISALTESMIVAAVAGMAIGLIIDMMTYFISMISITWIADLLGKINFINYYQNFTYGVLSIVDVVFFLSVTAMFLFFTVRILEKRRWS